MSTTPPPPRSPLKRLVKVLGVVALVFVLTIGISMFVCWRRANQAPEWWRPVNAADAQVDRAARSIENTVSDQIHRVRPAPANEPTGAGGVAAAPTWALTIKDDEANAWLAARLGDWLLNRTEEVRWPEGMSEPQVSFEAGVIRIGMELAEAPGAKGRVVSIALAPEVRADGGLWMQLQTFAIGRFTIPGGMAVDAGSAIVEEKLPPNLRDSPDTKNFIEALSGVRPVSKDGVLKLSDGRRLQIVRIVPKPGELELELRTLPR